MYVSKLVSRADITNIRVSAHTFRHTFAAMYLKNGGDVYKLSRLMGHSEVQITETYLKDFQSREARRDHENFSPVTNIRESKKTKKEAQIRCSVNWLTEISRGNTC
jgi:integrase/recombinase XerD